MRLVIDTDTAQLRLEVGDNHESMSLHSREAFEAITRQWIRLGWQQKYPYTFSWMGRPVIQLPEDMLRVQEVIYRVQPDVLIETGVAHGGSLVFYASLFKAIGKGRVIGVEIALRPANRQAIEAHPLSSYITLVDGSSTDPDVVAKVRSAIAPKERVMVILDSNHSKAHVAAELEQFAPLVTADSYIVATDGVMEDVADVPRGHPDWRWDNPAAAAREFASRHAEFVLEQPPWPFNESELRHNVTHWPDAWLRRVS